MIIGDDILLQGNIVLFALAAGVFISSFLWILIDQPFIFLTVDLILLALMPITFMIFSSKYIDTEEQNVKEKWR